MLCMFMVQMNQYCRQCTNFAKSKQGAILTPLQSSSFCNNAHVCKPKQWRIQEFEKGGHRASAKREPIMGVWRLCQWVHGQSPWLNSQGASPPEAERIYIING